MGFICSDFLTLAQKCLPMFLLLHLIRLVAMQLLARNLRLQYISSSKFQSVLLLSNQLCVHLGQSCNFLLKCHGEYNFYGSEISYEKLCLKTDYRHVVLNLASVTASYYTIELSCHPYL